jgi:hypothetical protein
LGYFEKRLENSNYVQSFLNLRSSFEFLLFIFWVYLPDIPFISRQISSHLELISGEGADSAKVGQAGFASKLGQVLN